MKTVNFTDFKKKASSYFSEVERGTTLVIIRHGKPIAKISPIQDALELAWKGTGVKLALKGASLSEAVIEERDSL